ncbi:hypothetical protein FM106_18720 [Brachybacterium faecium]|nr:hypothetical protein FM106_18720 [Brachybacterium faecium]
MDYQALRNVLEYYDELSYDIEIGTVNVNRKYMFKGFNDDTLNLQTLKEIENLENEKILISNHFEDIVNSISNKEVNLSITNVDEDKIIELNNLYSQGDFSGRRSQKNNYKEMIEIISR